MCHPTKRDIINSYVYVMCHNLYGVMISSVFDGCKEKECEICVFLQVETNEGRPKSV